MLQEAHRSSLPPHKDPPTTKAGQQHDLVMQPQAQQLALASQQSLPLGNLDSRANAVTHVLDWLEQHDLRDDAHSSSSTTVPNDNAEDDTCNDVPVFDAQLDAGSSISGEGAAAQVRTSSRIKHDNFSKDEQKNSRDIFLDEETYRWDQRQQHTGAVARLVKYREGESPQEDIFFRGGGRHHIILAGLRDGGQAAQAGVKVGDRLVSINGKKDSLGLQAVAIEEGLKAPVVLVFLGFVGKLEAEVRVHNKEQICGMSSRQDVVQGMNSAPLQLCEQRVFNVGRAPLLLTVMPSRRSKRHMQQSDDEGAGVEEEEETNEGEDDESREGTEDEVRSTRSRRQERRQPTSTRETKVTWKRTPGHSTSWTKHILEVAPCFELRRSDAHQLVQRALHTIENGTLSDDEESLKSSRTRTMDYELSLENTRSADNILSLENTITIAITA